MNETIEMITVQNRIADFHKLYQLAMSIGPDSEKAARIHSEFMMAIKALTPDTQPCERHIHTGAMSIFGSTWF